MNEAEALKFARKHIETWNSHDLDAIVQLYSESVELISPLAAALRGDPTVRGRDALRAYFSAGLQKYPALRFELVNTFLCHSSVTLLFKGAGERLVAEVLFIGDDQKIERVYAHYLCTA
jgi:hypothetical protein